MSRTISISEVVQKARPQLQTLVAKNESLSEVQPSPDMVDLVIWNVVVSFFVSIASSAAYDGLLLCFKNKGRVEPSDLGKLSQELNMQVVVPTLQETKAAGERIATLLQTQYFYAEKDAKQMATEAVAEIVSQVDVNA